MAQTLTAMELDCIKLGEKVARMFVQSIKPNLDQLNVIYDSAGGVKAVITQTDLNNSPELSELTKAQLDDAMFAMTSSLKTALDGVITQLTHLSSRAGL